MDSEKKDKNEKSNISDSFKNFTDNDTVQEVVNYAKSNQRDTLSYVVMVGGIIISFFRPWIGGALIGLIIGLYFADEIVNFLLNFRAFIDEKGLVKALILVGALIALFVIAPTIFLAAAALIGLKLVINPKGSSSD